MQGIKTPEEIVAYRLRELRGKRTQAQAAEFLDMPLRTYVSLEQGKTHPNLDSRKKIAQKYDIKETYLYLDPDLAGPTPDQIANSIASLLADPDFSLMLIPMIRGFLEHAHGRKKD